MIRKLVQRTAVAVLLACIHFDVYLWHYADVCAALSPPPFGAL